MWLEDAVAAYVERLTEREFDAPFISLLHHLGFTQVHLTHGTHEYGKDFVARRIEIDGGQEVEVQWCFQTKAGNINSRQLRVEVQPQVHLMRVGDVVHPGFDPNLKRRIVVVTTGRLVGSAASEFHQSALYSAKHGEVVGELWDIDTLVPNLVATLVKRYDVAVQARIMQLAGRLQVQLGTRGEVGSLARGWLSAGASPKDQWGDVLTACLLSTTAAAAGREDLALQCAWQLVRAFHRAVERGESPDPEILEVAWSAADAVARGLWEDVRAAGDPLEVTSRSAKGVDAFVTHPIKVARLCEALSMLALSRRVAGDLAEAEEIVDFMASFLPAAPALACPMGEEWMFSVAVTVVTLASCGRGDLAREVVRSTAVWMLDRVEDGDPIAEVGASAQQVVMTALGDPYAPVGTSRRGSFYTFAVLADLADALGDTELFADIINDMEALSTLAAMVVPTGVEQGRRVVRVDYVPGASPVASHHAPEASSAWPVTPWLDSLAIWATFRDRHLPGVLQAVCAD